MYIRIFIKLFLVYLTAKTCYCSMCPGYGKYGFKCKTYSYCNNNVTNLVCGNGLCGGICPSDWINYKNTTFYSVVNETRNYTEAVKYCRSVKAELISLNEQDKLNAIRNTTNRTWLGIHMDVDSNYYWMDGTKLAINDSSWCQGEPSNYYVEKCITWGSRINGSQPCYYVNDCLANVSFICEIGIQDCVNSTCKCRITDYYDGEKCVLKRSIVASTTFATQSTQFNNTSLTAIQSATPISLSFLSAFLTTLITTRTTTTTSTITRSTSTTTRTTSTTTRRTTTQANDYITAGALTSWGSWGTEELCPNKGKVIGYQLQYDDHQGGAYDDTAINSIKLYCADNLNSITSLLGLWGSWKSTQYCGSSSFMVGYKLRSESSAGAGDDTAANDLQMLCSNGVWLTNSNGGSFGVLGSSISCPGSSYICGLKTLVEPNQGSGDDTALNDVVFTCCY